MNKQELIEECKTRIAELEGLQRRGSGISLRAKRQLEIQRIALASLTAEPAAMFFKSEYGDVFNTESGWRPVGGVNLLYTDPPVQDLAALVPDEIPFYLDAPISAEWAKEQAIRREVWNACRAEMLRRIGEKDKC